MPKETSTTDERPSAREASHVEWLEQITKTDADNRQTNYDSKDVPDGSLLGNAPDEKQINAPGEKLGAEEADRQERITKRAAGELDNTNVPRREEKQEETEIAKEEQTRTERKPDSEEEEEETEDLTPGAFAFSNEQGNSVRRIEGHISASMVEEGQTKPLSLMENEEPAVVGLADTSSIIVAELVPDKKDAADRLDAELAERLEIELRKEAERLEIELAERLEIELAERVRKERELQVIAEVVIAQVADDSSICGLSRNCFFLVVAVLLLIIVGVVVDVVVALGGKDGDPPNMAPTAPVIKTTMPTMAPMAPTGSPTLAKFTQLLDIIRAVTSDIDLLQDRTTFQYVALDWLANVDTWEVDIDSVPSQVFVERYVLALLFFSTNGRSWSNSYNFLTPASVCEWTDEGNGVACNEDELFVGLRLGKSNHVARTYECHDCSYYLTIIFQQLTMISLVPFRASSEQ
jgi:hypothetical protein